MGRLIPIFEDESQWDKMLAILESWKGTPYRHLIMTKGRGADCTLFLAGALHEAKLMRQVSYDYYPRDWHIHTQEEMVVDSLTTYLIDNTIPGLSGVLYGAGEPDKLVRGDILGFKMPGSQVTNHSSMFLGGPPGDQLVIQSIESRGVSVGQWGPYWERKLTFIFRILKEV